ESSAAGPSPAEPTFVSGLEGVPAAETVLSHVDGAAGRLIVHGHELADFVARYDFESAAAMLWSAGAGMPEEDRDAIRAALGRARAAAYARFDAVADATDAMPPADALRLALASLGETEDAPIAVTGALPVFVANLARRAAGLEPVAPEPAAAQVEDFLRMLHGAAP